MRQLLLVLIPLSLCLNALTAAEETVLELHHQPVTIECTGMRLHTVLEQISKLTEVTILCGKKDDEWQVRDLPVIVCARELPLDKLLKAVADSLHLCLTEEKAGGRVRFRIWLDEKHRKEASGYFDAVKKAEQDRAMWDWDAISKLKDTPDSDFNIRAQDTRSALILHDPQSRALSAIIASLGTDIRDKVIAGQIITLTPNSVSESLKQALFTYFEAAWQRADNEYDWNVEHTPGYDKPPPEKPTLEDLTGSRLEIYMSHAYPAFAEMDARIYGSPRYYQWNMSEIASLMASTKDYEGGSPPYEPDAPGITDPEGKLKELSWTSGMSREALEMKLTLEAPKDKKSPSFADAICALSDKSGFSVVCEDFYSHRSNFNIGYVFGEETTLGRLINRLSQLSWYGSEEDKLLNACDHEWPVHHENLVQESLLKELAAKLDGDGIDLEDVLPVMALTDDQFSEWISGNGALDMLRERYVGSMLSSPVTALWKVYTALSPGDRVQAGSREGLALGKLDPAWLAKEFGLDVAIPSHRNYLQQLAGMVLHVSKIETPAVIRLRAYMADKPDAFKTHRFSISLNTIDPQTGEERPTGRAIETQCDFPIYSKEREKQIIEQLAGQKAG